MDEYVGIPRDHPQSVSRHDESSASLTDDLYEMLDPCLPVPVSLDLALCGGARASELTGLLTSLLVPHFAPSSTFMFTNCTLCSTLPLLLDLQSSPASYPTPPPPPVFQHIDIPPTSVHILNGSVPDLIGECRRYEEKIKSYGGIELFFGGIGEDGHLACVPHAPSYSSITMAPHASHPVHLSFNEPGSSLASRTRIKTLAQDTIEANVRVFHLCLPCKPRSDFWHSFLFYPGSLLRQRREPGPSARSYRRHRDRPRGSRDRDRHHWPQEGPGSEQMRRGGSQPPLDSLCHPAAPLGARGLRRGRDDGSVVLFSSCHCLLLTIHTTLLFHFSPLRAPREDCLVLQEHREGPGGGSVPLNPSLALLGYPSLTLCHPCPSSVAVEQAKIQQEAQAAMMAQERRARGETDIRTSASPAPQMGQGPA